MTGNTNTTEAQAKLTIIKDNLFEFYKCETDKWFGDNTRSFGVDRGIGDCVFNFYEKGFDIDKIHKLLTVDDTEFSKIKIEGETFHELLLIGLILYGRGYRYKAHKSFDKLLSLLDVTGYANNFLSQNRELVSYSPDDYYTLNQIFSSDLAILAAFVFIDTLPSTLNMTDLEIARHKTYELQTITTFATIMINIHYQKEDANIFPQIYIDETLDKFYPHNFSRLCTSRWLFEFVSLIMHLLTSASICSLFRRLTSGSPDIIPFMIFMIRYEKKLPDVRKAMIDCYKYALDKGYIYSAYILANKYEKMKNDDEAKSYLLLLLYGLQENDIYRYKTMQKLGDHHKKHKNYDDAIKQFMMIFRGSYENVMRTYAASQIFIIYINTDVATAIDWFKYISNDYNDNLLCEDDVKLCISSAIECKMYDDIYDCVKDNDIYLNILVHKYQKIKNYEQMLIVYCKCGKQPIHAAYVKEIEKRICNITFNDNILKAISSIPKTDIHHFPNIIQTMRNLMRKQIDTMELHFTYSVNGIGYKQAEDDYYQNISVMKKTK